MAYQLRGFVMRLATNVNCTSMGGVGPGAGCYFRSSDVRAAAAVREPNIFDGRCNHGLRGIRRSGRARDY